MANEKLCTPQSCPPFEGTGLTVLPWGDEAPTAEELRQAGCAILHEGVFYALKDGVVVTEA
jgi:hypothetical protein